MCKCERFPGQKNSLITISKFSTKTRTPSHFSPIFTNGSNVPQQNLKYFSHTLYKSYYVYNEELIQSNDIVKRVSLRVIIIHPSHHQLISSTGFHRSRRSTFNRAAERNISTKNTRGPLVSRDDLPANFTRRHCFKQVSVIARPNAFVALDTRVDGPR